jgi:hypothetical protein
VVPDLPFGPLPARSEELSGSERAGVDRVLRFPSPDGVGSGEGLGEAGGLEVARGPEGDDDVHFGVAAKALGVSRRTVERMVKRGELARGPSGVPATVSKRDLVAALEQRRRDVSHLTRATEVERAQSSYANLRDAFPEQGVAELQELLRPVLEPLLVDFIDASTRAAVLTSQMQGITDRAEQDRDRDELLLVLATGGWRHRRRARRAVLQRYVLRHGLDGPPPAAPGQDQ